MNFYNPIKGLINSFIESALHCIYPQSCLSCHTILPPSSPYLCESCSNQLDFIDPNLRCRSCFQPIDPPSTICSGCQKKRSIYKGIGAAFEYGNVEASLIRHLKYKNRPDLAVGLGASLFIQFDRLKWPLPDAIVPVPMQLVKKISRGYNQAEILAIHLGTLLNVPIYHSLKRKAGEFSQTSLSQNQRLMMNKEQFSIRKDLSLENKTLLVVDDVCTTGLTLEACGIALKNKGAKFLYGLVCCISSQT